MNNYFTSSCLKWMCLFFAMAVAVWQSKYITIEGVSFTPNKISVDKFLSNLISLPVNFRGTNSDSMMMNSTVIVQCQRLMTHAYPYRWLDIMVLTKHMHDTWRFTDLYRDIWYSGFYYILRHIMCNTSKFIKAINDILRRVER